MAIVSTAGLVPLIASSPAMSGARVDWSLPAGGTLVIVVTALACALCCLRLTHGRGMSRAAHARAERLLLLSGPASLAAAGALALAQTMVPLLAVTVVTG